MASPLEPHASAREALGDHERAFDTLHDRLKSMTEGSGRERLEAATSKVKAAHKEFADDVLGIVGTQRH